MKLKTISYISYVRFLPQEQFRFMRIFFFQKKKLNLKNVDPSGQFKSSRLFHLYIILLLRDLQSIFQFISF